MNTTKEHAQPTEQYHYHGIATPSKLYSDKTGQHFALVAFATGTADVDTLIDSK